MREEKGEDHRLITHKQSSFVPIIPVPQPGYIFPPLIPSSQPHFQYPERLNDSYREYLKLFRQNKLLKTQLNRVTEEKGDLQKKFNSLHVLREEDEDKKKRHRRMANEIDRDYVCPDENCNRSYGAETSLLQHIKLKHSEFYHSKQCEDFVRSLPKKANGEYKMQSN